MIADGLSLIGVAEHAQDYSILITLIRDLIYAIKSRQILQTMCCSNFAMNDSAASISFIIPTLNEAASLPATLDSIRDHVPAGFSYEVIVADNGSTDETVDIATGRQARVVIDAWATVGGLRNRAAREASGEVLVFLDADIELTKAWADEFPGVYRSLVENPWQVTGSRCGIPEQPGMIERYWFGPLLDKGGNYVNSGHMITTRELFDSVGGFDDSLETGEDYAFGQAAHSRNAVVLNNPSLKVIHTGYPKTLLQFIRREIWHGKGDCRSIKTMTKSKVASLAIVFFMLHVVTLASVSLAPGGMAWVFGVLPIAGICIVPAIVRHDAKMPINILVVSFLYYCYFLARFVSCLSVQYQSVQGKLTAG